MMPQLGVLAEVENESAKKAATDVFVKDCMIRLGTSVSAVGKGKEGGKCMSVKVTMPDGHTESFDVAFGEIRKVDLPVGQVADVEVHPAGSFDVGAGKGKVLKRKLSGGVVGLVFDARGRRPFELPQDPSERIRKLGEWALAMGVYPKDPRTLAG
ncbi:MAG: hypothetical protein DRN14_07385 [Thermoplasmata archaeon]|nr:MAG: hypothetical protein DRN14_07385 [Thermoplasmata archaeon]